jgi:hypothetical protein
MYGPLNVKIEFWCLEPCSFFRHLPTVLKKMLSISSAHQQVTTTRLYTSNKLHTPEERAGYSHVCESLKFPMFSCYMICNKNDVHSPASVFFSPNFDKNIFCLCEHAHA